MSSLEDNPSLHLEGIPLLESCPACGEIMDMRGIQIFTLVSCPACGVDFTARSRIHRYQILELLAEGGTAAVYRALEAPIDRQVALKIIKCGGDVGEIEKHERQAHAIASVEHPSIVRVFDCGSVEGVFYLAMEFLGGGSLDDLIHQRGFLDEVTVLEIGIEVAKALGTALEHGLIHRDIKPANILFSESRAVKLVDFGLSVQPIGEIWGTPNYIAPEKLEELPEDFRSDLYSLGSTLFHALTGHPPYETENLPLAELRILKRQPIHWKATAPWLGDRVIPLVERMMAIDPARRHGGYDELIEEMQIALEHSQCSTH